MEGGAQGRVRTGEEVGLEAEDLFSEDDDASSSEAEAEAEAKAAREVYDKGTPEYYGRHFKKFAKEGSKGALPGRISRGQKSSEGKIRKGKQGHVKLSCKKSFDRVRCADRKWKAFEASVFIMGIKAESCAASRTCSGDFVTATCLSPTSLHHAMSESDFLPRADEGRDELPPPLQGSHSQGFSDLPSRTSLEPILFQESSSDSDLIRLLNPAHRRKEFLQRLRCGIAEDCGREDADADAELAGPNRKLKETLEKAHSLWEEMQGPDGNPQTADTTWHNRDAHLRRLCIWQHHREQLSQALHRLHAGSAGCPGVEDAKVVEAWAAVREISHGLVQLGRNCATNVGEGLSKLPSLGRYSHRAISVSTRVISLLCRERDNTSMDRVYHRCNGEDMYVCMAAGGCDVAEGILQGGADLMAAVIPPPAAQSYSTHSECCQILLHVWQEAKKIMEGISKLVEVNGPRQLQMRYVLLVRRLVNMAITAMECLKDAVRELPRRLKCEDDMLRHGWFPEILCGLQTFVVDEVMWRVDDLSAALDLPVDDSCEFTEEVKRTVMAVRRQGEELQRHLSEIAFDATKYVHDLGEGHSISCLGIHGLQLLEQLATKVVVFVLNLFDSEGLCRRCKSEGDGIYDNIMFCSESCLRVIQQVKKRLRAEEAPEPLTFMDRLFRSSFEIANSDALLMPPAPSDGSKAAPLSPTPLSPSAPPNITTAVPQPLLEVNASRALPVPIAIPGAGSTVTPFLATCGADGCWPPVGADGRPIELPSGSEISRVLMGDLGIIPTFTDLELQLEWKLGNGSFGQVWYGHWYGKQDPVAVKVVGLYSDLSLRLTARDEDGLQSIGAEWDACRRLCNHENIVTFYNVIWWRPESPAVHRQVLGCEKEQVLCFVMEFCAYGTLYDLLGMARSLHESARQEGGKIRHHVHNRNLRESKMIQAERFYKFWIIRLSVAHQVAEGLRFMHTQGSHGIVHRDLTSYNVLLTHGFHEDPFQDEEMVPWLTAKICDFGYARLLRDDSAHSISRPSEKWQAPEVLNPDLELGEYSCASDVYCYGVILWEIITLQRPWKGRGSGWVYINVSQEQPEQLPWPEPEPWEPKLHTRDALQQLCRRCWSLKPNDRPTMQDVVKELANIRKAEEAAMKEHRKKRDSKT